MYDSESLLGVVTASSLVVWQSLGNIVFTIILLVPIHHSASLDWDEFQWTGIGDEEAIALADPRVIKNFKTLE